MARDFIRHCEEDREGFFNSLVTMDESWIHYSTPEMKEQSKQWLPKGVPPPKKAKVVTSPKKSMLVAFFDNQGMIYRSYVPQGRTINSELYVGILTNFLSHLCRKRSAKFYGGWLFHQDNAHPNVSQYTKDFMDSEGINLLLHAPYSPDLTPANFWPFPAIKVRLGGKSSCTQEELEVGVEGCVRQLYENGPMEVFERWQHRMKKCIELGGDYVEK